jgi:hypothetical protein
MQPPDLSRQVNPCRLHAGSQSVSDFAGLWIPRHPAFPRVVPAAPLAPANLVRTCAPKSQQVGVVTHQRGKTADHWVSPYLVMSRCAGEGANKFVLATRRRPSSETAFCKLPRIEGSEAPKGASSRRRACESTAARPAGRARLSALHHGSTARRDCRRLVSAQGRASWDGGLTRGLPAFPVRQYSELLAGRS